MKNLIDNHHVFDLGDPSVWSSCKKGNRSIVPSFLLVLVVLFYAIYRIYFSSSIAFTFPFKILSNSIKIEESYSSKNDRPFYLIEAHKYYEFTGKRGAFNGLDLGKIKKIEERKFQKMILSTLPPLLKGRLSELIDYTLKTALRYQVDPFWALAIMGTESHFNPKAKSYVDAYGLMQVMPRTAHDILRKLKKTKSFKHSLKLRSNPFVNIELGVFYLKRLLKTFDGSHRLATTAYNMGPNGVRRRLNRNLPVGVNNNYLNKVRKFYKRLSKNYIKEIKKTKKPTFSMDFNFLPNISLKLNTISSII